MNFFEQELRKLFDDGKIIGSPIYAGKSCFGTVGRDLRVRVDLMDTCVDVTVIDRTKGPMDHLAVSFSDLFGLKSPPEYPQFKYGVAPHIWTYNNETDWYAYHPTHADPACSVQDEAAREMGHILWRVREDIGSDTEQQEKRLFTKDEITIDPVMDFSEKEITAYIEVWFDVGKRFQVYPNADDSCDLYANMILSLGRCSPKFRLLGRLRNPAGSL